MVGKGYGRLAVLTALYCLLCCWLLVCTCDGQSAQQQPAGERATELADAVAKVKSGQFNGYHVGVIGEARAIEAIPDLEKQFTLISDPIQKAQIARVLLLLGDKKDAYWNYLAEMVKPAVESDAPSPINFDAQGKSIPGPAPEFAAWAKSHGQSPNDAGENAIYVLPGIVMMIGATGDSRALPLLRRALQSPNYQIEIAAALGLAQFQDKDSVPLIIEACHKAPAEVAVVMARSLVYFDNAEAQKTVDEFMPKDEAKMHRDARAHGEKPLGQ
jgi:hypothetical protein